MTELGRNTVAVAIVGGFAAACSNASDDRVSAVPPNPPDQTTASSVVAGDHSDPAAGTDASDQTTESEPGADANQSAGLVWWQVSLGSVSAYVLVRGNEAAVVDTGNPGSADQIGETLRMLGFDYDDVGHVVLTHHHGDHVGSLSDVVGRASSSVAYAGEADIGDISAPFEIRAVGDGDDVFGLQVIETPATRPARSHCSTQGSAC